VRHLLASRDQVMAVRGRRRGRQDDGVVEAVAAIEASGFKVFAFAPSADASRATLRDAGLCHAETVAHLLANPKLQKQRYADRSFGLTRRDCSGARDMLEILRIAGKSTRIILTGDTAQHAPVARGDAFD